MSKNKRADHVVDHMVKNYLDGRGAVIVTEAEPLSSLDESILNEFTKYENYLIPEYDDKDDSVEIPPVFEAGKMFTLITPSDEEAKYINGDVSHPLCCYVKLHRKDNGFSLNDTLAQLKILIDQVEDPGIAVDDFTCKIVRRLNDELSSAATRLVQKLRSKEHSQSQILQLTFDNEKLISEVIFKMDYVQCGLWEYHSRHMDKKFEAASKPTVMAVRPIIRTPDGKDSVVDLT